MSNALRDVGERIADTAAHLDAATHRLLTDLREFDAGGGFAAAGFRTCGDWLAWRIGWDPGTARDHVRVARALGELPLIDAALRVGEMSYSKVRAMTRVATPANERLLLADARLVTGEQLEKVCRKYAMAKRHAADATRTDDAARLRWAQRRPLANGMVKIETVLHPDEAAIVWAALDALAAEMMGEEGSAGTFDRADALLAMAQRFSQGGRAATPVELVVTVPAAALRSGAAVTPEMLGVLPDGDCIAPETARRLACDAGVVEMCEEPLSVGRKTRTIHARNRIRAAPASGSTRSQCVTAVLPVATFDENRLRSTGWRPYSVRSVPRDATMRILATTAPRQ